MESNAFAHAGNRKVTIGYGPSLFVPKSGLTMGELVQPAERKGTSVAGLHHERAPRKVGQPTKGKYSRVPTSSEDFAARKEAEIDLEERLA